MRKRGRQIRHHNAMIPGLIAQAACPEYETASGWPSIRSAMAGCR